MFQALHTHRNMYIFWVSKNSKFTHRTRVWPGGPYPRAELATHWFHHPSARGFPCHNNSDVLHILLLGVSFRVYISYKSPGPMEHIRILLFGVSFRVYISYKSPGPMEHIRILLLGVSFRVYVSYKSPGPMEHIRILLFGVSFRVYISYKSPGPMEHIRILLPVVPHKAVAEVSKIGNL